VPATQIAQNLAFINWTVLTGLALGSYAAVVLLRRRSQATRGFVGFTMACALAFGVLAWLSDRALPTSLGDSPVTIDPAWDAPRRAALVGFVLLVALGLMLRRVRPTWTPAVEIAAVVAAVARFVLGGVGFVCG
jgi:predicted membrane channel-forming protein YqfA (hemolysin III family)